jgi:hypothetical protein
MPVAKLEFDTNDKDDAKALLMCLNSRLFGIVIYDLLHNEQKAVLAGIDYKDLRDLVFRTMMEHGLTELDLPD